MDSHLAHLLDGVSASRLGARRQLIAALVVWRDTADPRFNAALDGLAVRAARDDHEARDVLLDAIVRLGLLRPAILRITVAPDVVAEVEQNTLVQVERNLHRFEGRSSLRTWLSAIARNETLLHFRRRQRAGPVAGESAADGTDPHDGRLSSAIATRMTLWQAVDGLPEPYRQTLRLRVVEQLSYDEIARTIEVPVGTVRSRISRSRELLSAVLER